MTLSFVGILGLFPEYFTVLTPAAQISFSKNIFTYIALVHDFRVFGTFHHVFGHCSSSLVDLVLLFSLVNKKIVKRFFLDFPATPDDFADYSDGLSLFPVEYHR